MAEYIEREAVIEAVKHAWAKGLEPSQYIEIIPSADVASVRAGNWRWITEDIYWCDNCGEMSHVKEVMGKPDWPYCPNCGAKMDLENMP